MDVQTLEISVRFPGRRRSRTERPPSSESGSMESGGGASASIADRRPILLAYTAMSIIAGLTALAWATQRVPIASEMIRDRSGLLLSSQRR